MNKQFGLFVVMLMGILVMFGVFAGSARAGQDSDAWTRVHADWPNYHGYYKVNPGGVVHEKWACNSDWQDCAGSAWYFPTDKFVESPSDTPCGENISTRIWIGTIEFYDDQGDVSDFLDIGKEYWFCDTLGTEIFRGSE